VLDLESALSASRRHTASGIACRTRVSRAMRTSSGTADTMPSFLYKKASRPPYGLKQYHHAPPSPSSPTDQT
jgi:hypothetical protein